MQEEGGPPEAVQSPETPRQGVIEAFNTAYGEFGKAIEPIRERWNEQSSLTPEEKKMLEDYSTIKEALAGCDKGYQVKVELRVDGRREIFREGVPVEGLIDFLDGEIGKLNEQLRENPNSEEIQQKLTRYKELKKIIEENSKPLELAQHPFKEARIRVEAFIRSRDPFRRSNNPNVKEREDEDWLNAETALKRRRELVLPSEAASPASVEGRPDAEPDGEGEATDIETTQQAALELSAGLDEELLKEFAHSFIEIIAQNGDPSLAIETKGKSIVDEAEASDSGLTEEEKKAKMAKMAFGLDLQIAALKMRQAHFKEVMGQLNRQNQVEEAQRLQGQLNEVNQRIETLNQERKEKAQGIANGLEEFAKKAFGVSDQEVKENPLGGVMGKITEAVGEPEKIEALVGTLKNSGLFTDKQINTFEKLLRGEAPAEGGDKGSSSVGEQRGSSGEDNKTKPRRKERAKEIARTVVGGIALLFLLMALIASKSER